MLYQKLLYSVFICSDCMHKALSCKESWSYFKAKFHNPNKISGTSKDVLLVCWQV